MAHVSTAAKSALAKKGYTVDAFSPKDAKRLTDELGYQGKPLSLEGVNFGAGAFDAHEGKRVKGVLDFTTAKTPKDKTIHDMLKDSTTAEAKKVTDDLTTVFTAGPKYKTAQTDYNEEMAEFKKLVAQTPAKYQPQDLIGTLKKISDEGLKAIKDQHKKERTDLITKFTDADFRKALAKALELTTVGSKPPKDPKDPEPSKETAKEIEKVKDNMIAELEAQQKKQLETFEATARDAQKKLHQASQKHMDEFLFLSQMYRYGSDNMRAHLKQEANKTNPELGINFTEDNTFISSVDMKQVEFFQLTGGQEIKVEGTKEKPVYTMALGSKLGSFLYYARDQDKKDFLAMAKAVQASGAGSIRMSITFNNPEVAMQRARDAYEACIKAGYPPEKIKIELPAQQKLYAHTATEKDAKDGKKYEGMQDKGGLFEGKEHRYKQILEKGDKIREEINNLAKSKPKPVANEVIVNEIRKDLAAGRAAAAKAPPAPPPPPAKDSDASLHVSKTH